MSKSTRGQPSLPPCIPMEVIADGIDWDDTPQASTRNDLRAQATDADHATLLAMISKQRKRLN